MSERPKTRELNDPVVFELGAEGLTAVALPPSDVPAADVAVHLPAELRADAPPPLPQVGELDLVRHYKRLSHKCFSVDENFYPLGSCTMKYNPRINERIAAMPAFCNVHPYQEDTDVQGLLEMLYWLRCDLAEIAGLAEVSLQPAAGAHGEMTGLMIINAYHRSRGEAHRRKVLAPDSAHGTNPATCTICGCNQIAVRSKPDGRVDLDDLRAQVDGDTAALMITNPNTVGVFDQQIADIAEIVHASGAQVYLDGANMNAILGIAQPGSFGVDVMHYNTHKTFSTPPRRRRTRRGAGGGRGTSCARFLPTPQVIRRQDGSFGWDHDRPASIGKVRSFYGQIGVLVRAYGYIRALGADGLRDVAEKAVLNANYVAARLKKHYKLPFPPPYAHEFIAVPEFEDHDVTELNVAKRLLDHRIHPPTMSWPIHHCLMIEPTETESLGALDAFVTAMIEIAGEAKEAPEVLRGAPYTTPVLRVDEVAASRKPNVRWTGERAGE